MHQEKQAYPAYSRGDADKLHYLLIDIFNRSNGQLLEQPQNAVPQAIACPIATPLLMS